jgi:hypothetical protein
MFKKIFVSYILTTLFLFFFCQQDLCALMQSSRSGVFQSTKAINDLVKTHNSFMYRFGAQSILRAFVGEMSMAKRIWGHYSLSAEIQSSLNKNYSYHSFEGSITRGFTDNKIYGLLSIGYRFGYFDKREHWLVFSSGTGFIPKPWGIESSVSFYYAMTEGRSSRLRAEIFGLYRFGGEKTYFDFGLQTSFYIIPSGELGIPDSTGYTRDNPLIEEFTQFEGGLVLRYTMRNRVVLGILVTNVIFINQTNYKNYDASTNTYSDGYGTQLDYAPKALLGLTVKI